MADDIYYHPLPEGISWLAAMPTERILVVGDPAENITAQIELFSVPLRACGVDEWAGQLHTGVYTVCRRGKWAGLIVSGGLEECGPTSGRRNFIGDSPTTRHLVTASYVLGDEWEDAIPFVGSSAIQIGDVIRVRDSSEIGRVRNVTRTPHGYRVEAEVAGQIHHFSDGALDVIPGDPRSPEFWVAESPASAEDIATTLTWTKLRQPLTDTLYSFGASKTLFRPYQFLPALKILTSSSGRLLIADEVGLGKTIEAGLVWNELEQRGRMTRTLVVTPSSLTQKWQTEMRRRFDRPLERLKIDHLQQFANDLRAGYEPELHGIISLESLRTAEVTLQSLAELSPRFDLIIVDEAHALRNQGTRSNTLGALLSDWADYLLFLSATPINLRSSDLFNLLTLLDDGLFSDKEIFESQLEPNALLNEVARRVAFGETGVNAKAALARIAALPLGAAVSARPDFKRLIHTLTNPAPLDPAARAEVKRLVTELNTLSGVLTRTRKIDVPDAKAVREPESIEVDWTPEERDFYNSVYAHYAAKSLTRNVPLGFAMQMPLRQAASCLPAMQERLASRSAVAFAAEVDDADDEGELPDIESLSPWSRPLPRDSKYEALLMRLTELRRLGTKQSMIFSTFRGTLGYLERRLSKEFDVRVLHGGVPMDDRQRIIDDFRAGAFEILLASEVGSEGLDFEFCNVLVNYDLPWNPMRVEQRIGRLDRFGQKNEKIFIFNMHVPGTIETDIFQRLYDRIGIFRNSIGDLEPILRAEFEQVPARLLDPRLSSRQRAQRADELAIALAKKSEDLKKLEESRATLTIIDQLAVDGLGESGPYGGKYVGPTELRRLLERLLDHHGASLSPEKADGTHDLKGTKSLADDLWRYRSSDKGTKYPVAMLQAHLREGKALSVTFDPEVASRTNVELVSVRHPLIHHSLEHLEQDGLRLRRYGAARIPGVPADQRYLVQVDLAEASGVRPLRELWATATEIDSGKEADGVGDLVLGALAAGQLEEDLPSSDLDVRPLVRRVAELAWSRQVARERSLKADNAALVEARMQSRLRSQQLKITKAEETLLRVRAARRDERVMRLHEGRLRNLRTRLEEIQPEMARQKELSLRRTTVAVLLVRGIS